MTGVVEFLGVGSDRGRGKMSEVSTQPEPAPSATLPGPPDPKTQGRDRRQYERHRYQFAQLLAPFRGDTPPNQDELREVRCVDLSAGGLSFFWPTEPDFEFAIVGLGKPPALIYMRLQVLRSVPSPSADGLLLIAGRFRGHHTW